MFVWSVKTTRSRLMAYGVVLGLLLTVSVAVGRRNTPVQSGGDDAVRVTYLQEQGYDVEPQWLDVREIAVPDADPIPAAYRGKRIKCFTYATTDGDRVCLYEYNGNVIAALPPA